MRRSRSPSKHCATAINISQQNKFSCFKRKNKENELLSARTLYIPWYGSRNPRNNFCSQVYNILTTVTKGASSHDFRMSRRYSKFTVLHEEVRPMASKITIAYCCLYSNVHNNFILHHCCLRCAKSARQRSPSFPERGYVGCRQLPSQRIVHAAGHVMHFKRLFRHNMPYPSVFVWKVSSIHTTNLHCN